jgi:ANTAR domain/GAF domain
VAIQAELSAAIGTRRGAAAADRLCEACVGLLDVDAAAISLVFDGVNSGTLGASSDAARVYDELQFTFGEGPCLDSVASRAPVLVGDLSETTEIRWPGYGQAMLGHKIRSVFAMPVALAGEYVGALDLFRTGPGMLDAGQLDGALIAATLAEMPLLDLVTDDLNAAITDVDSDLWTELASLTRVEISQATGMLIAQLDVDAAEALVRLRAYAYSTNRSASEVARDILDHGLRLDVDG